MNRLPNKAKTFAINKAGGECKVREAVGLDLPWVACSRRSDSRARRLLGSELKCTPGKRRGRGDKRVSPRLCFFVNFSPALYYLNTWNRLESGRFGPPFPATIKGAESQEPITRNEQLPYARVTAFFTDQFIFRTVLARILKIF